MGEFADYWWGEGERIADSPATEEIERLVADVARRHAQALDAVCRKMLEDPYRRGVLVTWRPDYSITIELSRSVPWCEIHELRQTTLPIEVY